MFRRTGDLELCEFVRYPSQKIDRFVFVLKNASRCSLRYETPYSGKIDVTITQNEAKCKDEKCRQSLVWDPTSRQGKIKSPEGGSLPPGDYIINNIPRTVYHQSENYDEVADAPVRRYEGAKMTVGVSQAFGECMKNNPTHLFCEHCRLPDNIQPNEDFTEMTITMNQPDKEYVYNIGCWIDVGWRNNLTWFAKVNFYEAEKIFTEGKKKDLDDYLAKMLGEESTESTDILTPTTDNTKYIDLPPTKKEPTEDASSQSFGTDKEEPHAITSSVTSTALNLLLLGLLLGIFLISVLLVMSCCIYGQPRSAGGSRINLFQHIKLFWKRELHNDEETPSDDILLEDGSNCS